MKCRMIVAALGLACCAGGASGQSLQPQFNNNGTVNASDMAAFLARYGQ